MKINNRKEIAVALYGFSMIVLLDILFVLFGKPIFKIDKTILYGLFITVFIFCIWRLWTLKIFSLEVSEFLLSVKYKHPFSNLNRPVLEIPTNKVISFTVEKGIINYILIINIKSRRGIRSFYYRLGKLPEHQAEKFKQMTDFISESSKRKEL
ncbi:MAG: hypothetical protein DI529_13665 [Chryseobacterium sp.]|nr:MAG: hypothetical protein DI529_13665 [Chryseobacterium sp.]